MSSPTSSTNPIDALFEPDTDAQRPWWRRRGAIAGAAIVLAAVLLAAFATGALGSNGAAYRTAVVTERAVDAEITSVATIEPVSQATVGFPTSGTVESVSVQVGDQVAAGDTLARLDTVDLERQLHTAEAALAQAELTLRNGLNGQKSTSSPGGTVAVRTASTSGTGPASTSTTGTASRIVFTAASTDPELVAAQQAVLQAQQQVDAALTSASAAYHNAVAVCTTADPDTDAGLAALEAALDAQREVQTAQNNADATALSAYIADEVRIGPVVVVPGMRFEVIGGALTDAAGTKESQQVALLPGLGVAYTPLDQLTVLAGVHRGFSPVAPGQTGTVLPETSTNGEFGVRVDSLFGLSAEAIGFISQYDNIVGECTFSAGCVDDLGVQQNGGAALIGGVEVAARHRLPLHIVSSTDALRTDASFTFTQARFLTDFISTHPLFGRVTAGDEMAYVPVVQTALNAAITVGIIDAGMSVGLVSAMRDVPGQEAFSAETAREWTDAQAIIDLIGSVEIVPGVRLGARVDNALDQRAIVSRRPFGARPGKPRAVLFSLEADIGR